jgi:hypothetical protein
MRIGIRTIILLILGAFSTYAVVYSTVYSVPDLTEVRYGSPLTWGANTLSTIAGAINTWRVDTNLLAVDVAFWFLVLITASAILNYRRGKSKNKPNKNIER